MFWCDGVIVSSHSPGLDVMLTENRNNGIAVCLIVTNNFIADAYMHWYLEVNHEDIYAQ